MIDMLHNVKYTVYNIAKCLLACICYNCHKRVYMHGQLLLLKTSFAACDAL